MMRETRCSLPGTTINVGDRRKTGLAENLEGKLTRMTDGSQCLTV
jgi:hypothetical protein